MRQKKEKCKSGLYIQFKPEEMDLKDIPQYEF